RGREEMAPPVPALSLFAADQSDISLMDEGGRLERLAGLLAGQTGGGELSQFVVDEWQQVGRGLRGAGLDGGHDLRDLGHAPRMPWSSSAAKELTAVVIASTVARAGADQAPGPGRAREDPAWRRGPPRLVQHGTSDHFPVGRTQRPKSWIVLVLRCAVRGRDDGITPRSM